MPRHGAVVSYNASTGAFTYDPTNGPPSRPCQVGTTATDTFTYTVTDNHGVPSADRHRHRRRLGHR